LFASSGLSSAILFVIGLNPAALRGTIEAAGTLMVGVRLISGAGVEVPCRALPFPLPLAGCFEGSTGTDDWKSSI